MPRWMFFLPVVVLACGAAVLGLRYGLQVASLTETQVINRFASVYVTTVDGGDLSDCHAENGETTGNWIVVVCTAPEKGDLYRYYVNWLGNLAHHDVTRRADMTPTTRFAPEV